MTLSSNEFILVTGSTGGIGTSVSHLLASKGHNLILVARNMERLDKLSSDLKDKHPHLQFLTLSVDMGSQEAIQRFGLQLSQLNPSIKGIVVMPPQVPPTEDCLPNPEIWQNIYNQSFIGPLSVLKIGLQHSSKSERCKVVIVSGISSAQVLSHYATANVIRLAWLAEAKTLAFSLGPSKIHVNTISFGGVMTPLYTQKIVNKAHNSSVTFEEQMASEVSNVPLRKYASTHEAAVAIEGLLSPFTDHITGMNILCDGGFTRAY